MLKEGRERTPLEWLEYRDTLGKVCSLKLADIARRAAWQSWPEAKNAALLRRMERVWPVTELVVWETAQWEASQVGSNAWLGEKFVWEDYSAAPQLWVWNGTSQLNLSIAPLMALDRSCHLSGILRLPCGERTEDADITLMRHTDMMSRRYGILFVCIFLPLEVFQPDSPLPWDILPRLRVIPAIFSSTTIKEGYVELLAANHWLSLPIIERVTLPIPRQQARAYERKKPEHSTAVQIVTLRRKVYEKKEGGEPQLVDWSCRWTVNGHWRKRGPNQKPGPPIWIDAYVKGPEDKPFKPPRQRIAWVRR